MSSAAAQRARRTERARSPVAATAVAPVSLGSTLGPVLRNYQLEAVEALLSAANDGESRALLVLPTGTGKTVVFAEALRQRGGRALVIAHREELLDQAGHKLVHAGIGKADIGLVKAERKEVNAPVVLASIQTLSRKTRRSALLDSQDACGVFRTVVIDEAHHAPATTYKALLRDLDPMSFVIGATATPARQGMGGIFGKPVYSRELTSMMADGWLCDVYGRRIALDIDLGNVRRKAGDFVEADLAEALANADAPEAVARAWIEEARGRPTIVFTAGVDLAHMTAKALCDNGVRAEVLDGETPSGERRAMLKRYAESETEVLVNCSVLTEGVDLPQTACIVIARPTLSLLLYAQMIGRGTRIAANKKDCLVLDLVGASDRHRLALSGRLARSPQACLSSLVDMDVPEGTSVLGAWGHKADAVRLFAEHDRLVAKDVDLFSPVPLHWLVIPHERRTYLLGLGREGGALVAINDGPDTFVLYHLGPGRDGETTMLKDKIGFDEVAAHAEELAFDYDADPFASWRSRPVTEAQLKTLYWKYKQRKDLLALLNSGQASDMLEVAFARERLEREGLLPRSEANWREKR